MLTLAHVEVDFGGVKALDNVSFDVRTNRTVGFIGPNGAGKTTLFDVIAGARPVTRGRVAFDGTDVTATGVVHRARLGIRRTFQRQQIWPWLTVEENILVAIEGGDRVWGFGTDLLGGWVGRRRERTRRRAVAEVLHLVGIEELAGTPAGHLPIGKMRLAELARAVVARPRVLLLDEPTSGLTEHDSEVVRNVIDACRAGSDMAVLLIEHDIDFVLALSDEVHVLERGRIIFTGSPAEVKASEAVRAAFLGTAAEARRVSVGDGAEA